MNSKVGILLVEDNLSDAEMIIRALYKSNLTTNLVHLKDGAAAIDFIFGEGDYSGRNVENQPKVIFLDLKMPKVNGIQVLQKIKSDERTKNIPVVVLTSSKEDPDIKECQRLDANSYVVKPLQFEEFVKVISELGLYWLLLNQPHR